MRVLILSLALLIIACEQKEQNPVEVIPRNTATIEHYSWMRDYADQHNLVNVVCRRAQGFHEDAEICTAQDSLGTTIRVAFWGRNDVIPFSITKDPL